MSALATTPEPSAVSSDNAVAAAARQAKGERIHYLDNLRACAMLLGVYLHGAFAYANPAQSVWLATDTKSSVAIDASIWWIHLFRMGLFFLLSGYFAQLVLQRKSIRSFILGRLVRVVLPFAIFYPFLIAGMLGVIVFSLSYLKTPSGLMGVIASAVRDNPTGSNAQPLTTMHLWFLYYLFQFNLLSVLCSLVTWPRVPWRWNWSTVCFLSPLLLIPGVLGSGVPLAAPESFVPTWWPFAFYGCFYAAGSFLYGHESVLRVRRWVKWWMLFASIALFSLYYITMPTLDINAIVRGDAVETKTISYGVCVVSTAYLSVWLTICALLFGKEFLEKRSFGLSFMADASYWTYLLHLPLVMFLQTLFIPMDWPVFLKLACTLLGTVVACLATYVVFVRYTPVGWMLHGKRAFP